MEAGRSLNPKKFLTKDEQRKIIDEIKEVEKKSICEIRLHIAKKIKSDIIEEAKKVFYKLEMDKTKERTGVLFFFAIKNRQFAIIGDSGINEKVSSSFWQDIVTECQNYFKEDKFGEGIVIGIKKVGEVLQKFFPFKPNDVNELTDEISFD